jgi:hypothetical protein
LVPRFANENNSHYYAEPEISFMDRTDMRTQGPARSVLSTSLFVFATLAAGLTASWAFADEDVKLVLENHKFDQAEIKVPANMKIRIVVDNRDATPEEFESTSLRAEKVIPGKTKGVIMVGPLKPGRYPFSGEYNAQTAQGVMIAE